MRLPNGKLETTNAENDYIFGLEFDIFFNNNRPIYWTVLDKIKKIDVAEELDPPISWDGIKNSPQI